MAIMAFVSSNFDARNAGVFSGLHQVNPVHSAAFTYTSQNMLNAHPRDRWRAKGNATGFMKDGNGPDDQRRPMPVKERTKRSWATRTFSGANIVRTNSL